MTVFLRKTLATLTGRDDAALLDALAQAFRDDYDTRGYTRTEVYAGVPEMLQGLQTQGIALHIVTNKRIAATRRILDHLGWRVTDLTKTLGDMATARVKVVQEPRELKLATTTVHFAFIEDPGAVKIEVVQR